MDTIVPIVFPEYRIRVETPKTEVDVFPWFDFDNFSIPAYKDRFSNLGHAGILFVKGKTGTTKYYEFGRYDPPANLGLVRRIPLSDATLKDGRIDLTSLKKALAQISKVAGQNGKITGVYIEIENKFDELLKYAEFRKMQNANKNRKPYDILTYSCIHFVKEMTQKAGVDTPWMVDPRPNSYIGEFRDDFQDLDYSKNILTIEELGTF